MVYWFIILLISYEIVMFVLQKAKRKKDRVGHKTALLFIAGHITIIKYARTNILVSLLSLYALMSNKLIWRLGAVWHLVFGRHRQGIELLTVLLVKITLCSDIVFMWLCLIFNFMINHINTIAEQCVWLEVNLSTYSEEQWDY